MAYVLAAPPARSGDVERARTLFAEGVRLYQRDDFEGARRLFRDADGEHHAPSIVYNLGLAEEKLGHVQAAVDAYESYLAEVGDAGELSSAAAIALAQLKARATRLRIESRPPGARVFVDGAPLPEPAPATVLVGAGHHVVVAQGAGWREEVDIQARGAGDVLPVVMEPRSVPPPPDPPSAAPTDDRDVAVVWGVGFAFAPYYLLGVTTPGAGNERDARSVVAGPTLEAGLSLTRRLSVLLRGFAALGPDGKPSYAFMGGPGFSARIDAFTLGASFIGGRLETHAHGARYGTDLVFGAMGEIGWAVVQKRHGAWMVTLNPSFLLTELRQDNTAFLLPVSFGYRSE